MDYLFVIYSYNYFAEPKTNGSFACKDALNTMIPQSKVCNFIRDCSNAADEVYCGMYLLIKRLYSKCTGITFDNVFLLMPWVVNIPPLNQEDCQMCIYMTV